MVGLRISGYRRRVIRSGAVVAVASAVCLPFVVMSTAEAAPTTPPFTQCPAAGTDASCQFLIVINSDGTVSGAPAFDASQGAYDGINDALIGVQNNSGSTLYSIQVSASEGSPFSFDGDGPCVVGSGAHPSGCSQSINGGNGGLPQNTSDTTGYGGPSACFTSSSALGGNGMVGFAGGIPAGGSTWFALNAFGNDPGAFQLGQPDENGPSPCGGSTGTTTTSTSTTTTSTTTTTQAGGSSCSTDGATASTDNSTGGDPVTRLFGSTRIGTAVALSLEEFPKAATAHAVVLAREDVPWDALSGGPLAGAKHGPLLLTESTGLDPATQCEIDRVLPQGGTVFILGGPAAVSSSVDSTLTGAGYQVVRLYGADRFATAVAVMTALGDPTLVFEATGLNFPDALAAGPAAIVKGAGILLTNGSTQAPETASYLQAHPGDTRYALGGPAAAADPGATAIVGQDRYDTATQIAAKFFSGPQYVAVADGVNFPDALAGGPFAGFGAIPLLLVPSSGPLSNYDVNYLAANKTGLTAVILFGGSGAVGDDVENEVGYDAANAEPAPSPSPNPPPSGSVVSVTASSSGFVFQNATGTWMWVSFTPRNCQNVASSEGCDGNGWADTISLGPDSSNNIQSCALMEDISSGASSYSYQIQWTAYSDPSNGNDYQPTSSPAYSPTTGSFLPVTEQAGTDHGADTCISS